jgi:hypothetical protein
MDGPADLTSKDVTRCYPVDGREATHNRSVAGSRPASPTRSRMSQACGTCLAWSVVIPWSFFCHRKGMTSRGSNRDPQTPRRPPGPGSRRPRPAQWAKLAPLLPPQRPRWAGRPSSGSGWPWGAAGWLDGLALSVSRRAGGVGARRERARRRGRHRRLTTSPTKPAQPARATLALASGRRRSRGIPGVRGLRDRKEPTWTTIGPTIGPTASACCSTSSTVPARSLRHVWTGWPRRRASRKGRRCPPEGRRAAHRRGVPVGAGARRLVDPPPR